MHGDYFFFYTNDTMEACLIRADDKLYEDKKRKNIKR